MLKVNPVVLGRGIPLFAGGAGGGYPAAFALATTQSFASGVVVAEYERV